MEDFNDIHLYLTGLLTVISEQTVLQYLLVALELLENIEGVCPHGR